MDVTVELKVFYADTLKQMAQDKSDMLQVCQTQNEKIITSLKNNIETGIDENDVEERRLIKKI